MIYHNKLVRDKIPKICEANGDLPRIRTLDSDSDYLNALTSKLLEESAEVQEDPSLDELADAVEVIQTIAMVLGYTPQQIEEARAKKAAERGGFNGRIFLISTEPRE